ncbi:hypothetical protein pdam_00003441, partial [Pocillopora damicornis]
MDSVHFKLKQINVNKLASESKAKPNEVDKLLAVEKFNLVLPHSLSLQKRTTRAKPNPNKKKE